MYNYALVAKPLFDEPFLTYVSKDDTRKWCNYQEYNALIKKIAIHCGFKDIHFSTHSLRRGGATLLALAGHPNHYIRGMMRSKSDSFMRYRFWCHAAISEISVRFYDFYDGRFIEDQSFYLELNVIK